MVGEFDRHLPDPSGGFVIGDAAVPWDMHGGGAGLLVGVGLRCGGVGGDCRWYCLIARWFSASGDCMVALHSDI
jgi:hypothetical protein